MISQGPKHGFRSQNQVSKRLRTKFIVSLLEVVLGLLQPLHPVLDLQVCVRLGSKWFPMAKNLEFDTKTKSLAWPEQKLEIPSSKWFWTSYISFLTFRLIWGLWKWFQMIPHAQKPGVCHQYHVSSLSRRKVTDLAILRGMIFPKYFLTPPKKSWNRQKIKKRSALYFISFQSC